MDIIIRNAVVAGKNISKSNKTNNVYYRAKLSGETGGTLEVDVTEEQYATLQFAKILPEVVVRLSNGQYGDRFTLIAPNPNTK